MTAPTTADVDRLAEVAAAAEQMASLLPTLSPQETAGHDELWVSLQRLADELEDLLKAGGCHRLLSLQQRGTAR